MMRMKELCEKTGLQDRTIRFYISSGLLLPNYNENYSGRRNFNFSDDDVIRLKQIMLLRKYGFSLGDIKKLMTDFSAFGKILDEHLDKMKADNAESQKLTDDLLSVKNIQVNSLEDFCSTLDNIDYIKSRSLENENDSNAAYQIVYEKSRKKYRIIICIFICLFVGIVLLFVSHELIDLFYTGTPTHYAFVKSNGEYVELYSKRYVPIEPDGYKVKIDDEIISNEYIFSDEMPSLGYWSIAFDKTAIYKISNVKNNDLIFLKTDYESDYSPYYVLEDKYDYYKSMIDNFSVQSYAYCLTGLERSRYIIEADKEINNIINSAQKTKSNFSYNKNKNYHELEIFAYESNGIFYQNAGKIISEGDNYYLVLAEDSQVYDVSADYYDTLDILFCYNMR